MMPPTSSQVLSYGAGKSEAFAYDPVGNRTQAGHVLSSTSSTSENYSVNNLNQYLKVNSTTLVYDDNGNLINDGSAIYTYDAQNRLTAVESATTRAEFFYDAKNRCVVRKYYTKGSQGQWVLNTTDSRVLTYDASWNLLAERTLDGKQVGEYIFGLRTDEILSAQLGSKTYYPLTDGLGSTVALTGKNGKVAERYRYTAYGTPHVLSTDYRPLSTGSTYRFLFTGREWLASIGLNDHRNRYYSPRLGRFLQIDPIRFAKRDSNLYRYVYNLPANLTDIFGLCCEGETLSVTMTRGPYETAHDDYLSHSSDQIIRDQQDVTMATQAFSNAQDATSIGAITVSTVCAAAILQPELAWACATAAANYANLLGTQNSLGSALDTYQQRLTSDSNGYWSSYYALQGPEAAYSDAQSSLLDCTIRNLQTKSGCPCK